MSETGQRLPADVAARLMRALSGKLSAEVEEVQKLLEDSHEGEEARRFAVLVEALAAVAGTSAYLNQMATQGVTMMCSATLSKTALSETDVQKVVTDLIKACYVQSHEFAEMTARMINTKLNAEEQKGG